MIRAFNGSRSKILLVFSGWVVGLLLSALPAQSVLFNDDFEDASISDWVVLCGGWEIVEGFGGGLAVASTQLDNVLVHSSFSGGFGHYHYDLYFPDDYRADGDLLFQIVGSEFYWILVGPGDSDNPSDAVLKATNSGVGSQEMIACAPYHLTKLEWHRIDVYRFPNGVIQVFMDGEATPQLEAYDTSVSSAGGLAIRTFAPGVRFDNVSFDEVLPSDPPPPVVQSCLTWGGLLPACAAIVPPPPPPPPHAFVGLSHPTLVVLTLLLGCLAAYGLRADRRTVH